MDFIVIILIFILIAHLLRKLFALQTAFKMQILKQRMMQRKFNEFEVKKNKINHGTKTTKNLMTVSIMLKDYC